MKIRDKRNNQVLELVRLTFKKYSEPFLEKGVIGRDEKGQFFDLDFEDVELLGPIYPAHLKQFEEGKNAN